MKSILMLALALLAPSAASAESFHLTNAYADTAGGTNFGLLQHRGLPPAEERTATGWTVGLTMPRKISDMHFGVERASSTFVSWSAAPYAFEHAPMADGATGNCFRTQSPLEGTYMNAGEWSLRVKVSAGSMGGRQDGRLFVNVRRAPVANPVPWQSESIFNGYTSSAVNLGSTPQVLTISQFVLGGETSPGDHLFVCLGWEITGAGNKSANDVLLVIDPDDSVLRTPDFAF